ncbi:MAG: hypothetical protein H8E47_02745 [Anaerolineales bacterium]|nr:hypothetical protein [Anaerolineales bacterium]
MASIKITLHPSLDQSDSNILARYLQESHRFYSKEWQALMRAIDRLERSQVWFQGQRYTFRQFYRQMIDDRYAGPFLEQLYNLADVGQKGRRLWAARAREIARWLRQTGLRDDQTDYAGYLAAYCLYWWSAFARGYIFELSIFRKLESNGVIFSPHDPRQLSERYAGHDLTIGDWKGDVKLSFYFLPEMKAPPLDFYVTRLYDRLQHVYQIVVLMQMTVWEQIDGDTLPGHLAAALYLLPHPVRSTLGDQVWVLSLFADWKHRSRRLQGEK